jgi:hypothetical protein
MKKLLFLIIFSIGIGIASHAQDKDKLKKTSTAAQKVHNTVSHHKRYKGYKIKHKHNGAKRKHKVYYKSGHVKDKVK